MRLKILRQIGLLCSLNCAALLAHAQPAEEFFHGGAQSYITNNVANARTLVDSGLKLYPDDAKLKKLDELLKQQQQQQNQDQQQQQQQQQNQQDQQKQDQKNQQNKQDQKQQQQNQNDQQKQDQKSNDQKPKDQQPAKDQKAKADQKQKDEGKDGQQAEAQPVEAKSMTPEEAKRLLDSEKGDEKLLRLQAPGKEKPEDPEHPRKDW
jgi:site-specific DNA-cytosine methylase